MNDIPGESKMTSPSGLSETEQNILQINEASRERKRDAEDRRIKRERPKNEELATYYAVAAAQILRQIDPAKVMELMRDRYKDRWIEDRENPTFTLHVAIWNEPKWRRNFLNTLSNNNISYNDPAKLSWPEFI